MVLEKKPESSKDLASEKKNNKVKSSTSTEPAATNIMETTDTDNSNVDGVNINKFGAKKTSRWNQLKIDVSLKDLEKVPTRRSKRISKLQKDKTQSQVKYYLLLTRYHKAKLSHNIHSILYEYSSHNHIH